MKRLVVLLSLFLLAVTERRDLSGQMFTFPVESNTAHVSLIPDVDKIFFSVTVCLRAFSDLSKGQSLFSISLPSSNNSFLIYKSAQGQYQLHVSDTSTVFQDFPDELSAWNSACAIWDSSTGLTQLWVNGHPSSRKGLMPGGSLMGRPKIILGQKQNTYGGSFHIDDSFVGMLTDVHMWDYVLPPHQIKNFSSGFAFEPGNFLNWADLQFSENGYVVTESKKTSMRADSYDI